MNNTHLKNLSWLIIFPLSFIMMLVGINNLISLATKPQSDTTAQIAKIKSNIKEIDIALSQKKMGNIKNFFPELANQVQASGASGTPMEAEMIRKKLLEEKNNYLNNLVILYDAPKVGLSVFNLHAWFWSIITWTAAMIYKTLVQEFSNFLIKRLKSLINFLKPC